MKHKLIDVKASHYNPDSEWIWTEAYLNCEICEEQWVVDKDLDCYSCAEKCNYIICTKCYQKELQMKIDQKMSTLDADRDARDQLEAKEAEKVDVQALQ